MAVYTKLNENEIKEIILLYGLKNLQTFSPIEEGIENTNYIITADNTKYILTIFEKRVKEQDLPFFCELILKLNQLGFKCPKPLINNKNNPISDYKNKKLTILTFIEGKSKKLLDPRDCKLIGIETARLHKFTSSLSIKRKNALSVNIWRKMFENIKENCASIHIDLPKLIESNLK